ncbi:hypothetical protein DCE79_02525 [Lysinibacillus sp. 2017]|uniref:S-layer homology domain-containing protein n=1 Tax=unclassified Lysinibacillus TaxID=2636778 RepID=UPI000D52A051|nr:MULTISPECIES: S-layer homology domain-containing protein [unclassified Lysinibacillus]AWE06327.1 hypothetical protein DCE79_02525 [Lysinibacillus sp. 2017]TGN34996.1 hypothetical protein E4L99_11875 [Lysinibacillus sp. S2017]
MAKTNKGRKLFATTATAALVASAIVPVASAAQVNDLNTVSSYAQEAVQDLVDRGVIEGDAKGNFNPKNSVTRAEGATILVKALDADTTATINFTDVKAGAWYYDAINAAVNNGYFQGQGAGKFNPSGNLTRSEAAIIFVNAFGLEGSANLADFSDAASVKSWAKEALEIAVANGVIKGDNGKLNPNANITKQDFAVMFSRAEEASVNPAADLKAAVENLKETVGKLADKVTAENATAAKTAVADTKAAIEVTEKALEAAKEAKVVTDEEVKAIEEGIAAAKTKLEAAEKLVAAYEESLTTVKVESVSATNLKEVVVQFNTTVSAEEAEKITNYKLDGATLNAVSSATLSEDKKSVVINFSSDGPTLTNQKVHKLTVSGITKLASAEYTFTALDVTVPEVKSVEVLGNKVINVHFSEPVKKDSAQTRINYKVNGFVVNGEVELSEDGKTATITLYSRLKAGVNKVSVAGVQDYANMTIINYLDKEFTVADDTAAPASFSIVSATLDAAIVKFDEAVDAETVKASNIYWTDNDGVVKHGANSAVATDSTFTTYKIIFADNKLPARETTLVIEKASDLFGNVASKLSTKVTATVDVTRPEVSSLGIYTDEYGNFTAASSSQLDIKFNKAISTSQFTGVNSENLVVKNAKGEVVAVASSAVAKAKHTNTLTVTLSNALEEGKTYSVEVKNVVDGTALNNKMIPQTFTIAVPEITAPTVTNVAVVDAGAEGTKVQVVFSNSMALDGEYSVLKSDRYMIKVGTSWYLLPAGTTFQPTYDSKAVIITIPKDAKYDGTNVLTAGAITGFKTTLVADKNGNKLAGLTKEILDTDTPLWGNTTAQIIPAKTIATAKNKVKVVLDRPLQVVYASDFLVNGTIVPTSASYETVDGQGVVTLTLPTNLSANVTATVSTVAQANVRSLDLLGNKIPTVSGLTVQDGVAPSLVASTTNTGINAIDSDTIELHFDENLSSTFDAAPANKAALAGMFTIKVGLNQSKTLIAGTDYVADIKDTDTSVVEIDFLTPLTATEKQKITVSSNDAAMYIFDFNAFNLTGGYTYANKVKFGTTAVGNAGILDVAAAAAAAAVQGQIASLPVVGTLTYADKTAVDTARAAYDALSADAKALVTNVATLTAAETEITRLGNVITSVAAPSITTTTGTHADNAAVLAALGTTVTVTKEDGTIATASVAWTASADYDAATAGDTVIYTGVVTPTAPTTQPTVPVSVTVTVTK